MPCLVAALVLTAPVGPAARAGTIRDDRADADYTQLSENAPWQASGQMLVRGQASCSASLIAPQWVLCAAHCVMPQSGFVLSPQTFSVAGRTYAVDIENTFINRKWIETGFDVLTGEGDLALFRLPEPVEGIQPIPCYRARDEVGNVGFSLGYGRTGTGLVGQVIGTSQRRAGQNMIDGTAARVAWPGCEAFTAGNDRMLLYDFDSPQRNYSSMGSANPLQLEYTTAQGDSGGPLFVFRGGRFMVAGICSGGAGPCGRNVSTYGDTATFARVSSYTAWIKSVMDNGQPSLAVMIRSGQVRAADIDRARGRAAERASALERHGVRLTPFMEEPGLRPADGDAVASLLAPAPHGGRGLVAAVAAALAAEHGVAPHAVGMNCVGCGTPAEAAATPPDRDAATVSVLTSP